MTGTKSAWPVQKIGLRRAAILAFSLGLVAASCSSFNPAFLNLLDPTGEAGFSTIPNPPGHVVVAFVNNTEFDERLIGYLAPQLGLSEAEIRALRPRVRMRVQIVFTDGSTQTVEMIDGTRSFVDPDFSAEAVPDLNQNDLYNVVGRCDVAAVGLVPGSSVDVYIPVELIGFQLVETTGVGGEVVTEFEERQRFAPTFRASQADDVDADGNVILQRNVGIRDLPSPTTNVLCGSVVAITIRGTLSVPFLEGESTDPSFDIDDEPTEARIGGRFEFDVIVR